MQHKTTTTVPTSPTIGIMTSYMHQRGGDLVAAISLIKAMLANPDGADLKFKWVVKRDISSYEKDLASFLKSELGDKAAAVELTVLDSADYQKVDFDDGKPCRKGTKTPCDSRELTRLSNENWGKVPVWHGWKDIRANPSQRKILQDTLSGCTLVTAVGDNHRLIQEDHDFIHEKVKRKFIAIPEYDLKHENNQMWGYDAAGTQKAELIKTGFSSTSKGVYIDDTIKAQVTLENADSNDKNFTQHLLGKNDKTNYKKENALFYGYFFDNDSLSPKQYTVKIESYIQNTIMLAIDNNQQKNIDLVIPGFKDPGHLQKIYVQAINGLPQAYKEKLKTANYDLKQASGQFDSSGLALSPSSAASFNVRLINPQRLQRKTVQAMLTESEPWVGLTGDASWIEGLMKGKITCYQALNWKRDFFDSFIQFAEAKLGKTSPLLAFYKLQSSTAGIPVEQRWERMREIYRDNKLQMLAEAGNLAKAIERDKNLNETLIKPFIQDAKKAFLLQNPGATLGASNKGPAPGATNKGPAPSTTTKSPAPSTTTKSPAPGTTTKSPAPGTTTKGPAPGTTTKSPAPGTTTKGPAPSTANKGPTPGTNPADSDYSVSTPGTGLPSRSQVLKKSTICFSPPMGQWHASTDNSQVYILRGNKAVEDAKQILFEEIAKPADKQAKANTLSNAQLSALDTYAKGEVRAIKYSAPEVTGTAASLVAGSTLLQCGIIATCIAPGKKMGLDLVIPPDVQAKMKNSTVTEKDANFNTLVFAHVHKAIQAQVEALRKSGGTGDPVINLNKITDPDTHKFTAVQLAMIQYCHLKGYPCLGKNGQKLGEEILNAHKMEIKKSGDFYEAFNEFTKVTPAKATNAAAADKDTADADATSTKKQGMSL